MLSYEEELALSDLLDARRAAIAEIEGSDQNPSPQQQEAIKAGNSAASLLVENYLPAIRSMASAMLSKSIYPKVTFDDLVNQGTVEAMLRTATYDCRKGKRFANYAGKAITKSMGRLMAKMSIPLSGNVDVIITSYDWSSARNELRNELGHEPTDEQIEDRTGIDREYVAGAPQSSSIREIDSEDDHDDLAASPQYAEFLAGYAKEEALLRLALSETFEESLAEDLGGLFGLDRMYVRDRDEFKEWKNRSTPDSKKIGPAAATNRIRFIRSALTHPMYRVALARALKNAGMSKDSTPSSSE